MPKQKDRITLEQARKLYPDEWVLFSDASIDPANTAFTDGLVYFHDRDPQKVHEKARELKTGGAIFFTGTHRYRRVTLKVDEIRKAAA